MNHETPRPPETDPAQINRMAQINAAWEAYQQLAGHENLPTDDLLRSFTSQYIGTYTAIEDLLWEMSDLDRHLWDDSFRIVRDGQHRHLYGTRRSVTEHDARAFPPESEEVR